MNFSFIALIFLISILSFTCAYVKTPQRYISDSHISYFPTTLEVTNFNDFFVPRSPSGHDFRRLARKASNKIIKELVAGDNIFRIHSAGATLLGFMLLFFPNQCSVAPAVGFAYHQLSFFILVIAALTFRAPKFEANSKMILARTLGAICFTETALYIHELSMRRNFLNTANLLVSLVSLMVFSFLTFGYYASGNMKLERLKFPFLSGQKAR